MIDSRTDGWLDQIHRIEGVTDVMLIGGDGLRIASRSQRAADELDRLAASLSMLHALADGAARYFDGEAALCMSVRGEGGFLAMVGAGLDLVVAALINADGDVGQVIVVLCGLADHLVSVPHTDEAVVRMDALYLGARSVLNG
jgi:predicted regulator of Ras-like GTPase activity (Roadblock/LC7/MglB family)